MLCTPRPGPGPALRPLPKASGAEGILRDVPRRCDLGGGVAPCTAVKPYILAGVLENLNHAGKGFRLLPRKTCEDDSTAQ